jgi:hypothetical protein
MTAHRRVFRPTMANRRRGDGRHKQLRAIGAAVDLLLTGTPVAPAGTHDWRRQHERKSAMTFCEALRHLRAMSVARYAEEPLNVYGCDMGPDLITPGVAHWHVGRLRGGQLTRDIGVTFIAQAC